MVGFGYYFYRHAPKEINDIFGYRTRMSMLNEDTWQFAHHYAGKLWFKWGIVVSVSYTHLDLFLVPQYIAMMNGMY